MSKFIEFVDHELIPIDEAAKIYGCNIRGLLRLAVEGKIELLVPVCTSNLIGVKHSVFGDAMVVQFNDGKNPELIALNPVACGDLYLRQKAKICEFDKGYYISRGKLVEAIINSGAPETVVHPKTWVHFSLAVENGVEIVKPVFEDVFVEMVYVARDNDEKIYDSLKNKLEAKHKHWLSSDLDILARAATKFWSGDLIDLNESDTYPKTDDIINYFLDQNISQTDAKFFARIIRPHNAMVGARKMLEHEIEERAKSKKIKKTPGGLIQKLK